MKCEDSIGFHIKEVSHLMDRVMFLRNVASGADKLTASHGWMIRFLYHNRDREIYQKTMESEFHMPKSTVTSILQAMEKNGYITREAVAHDARLKKIHLTEAGEAFYRHTEQSIREVEEQMTAALSKEDLDTFVRIIGRMEENLKQ